MEDSHDFDTKPEELSTTEILDDESTEKEIVKKYKRKVRKKYSCDICSKTFTNREKLETHIKTHEVVVEKYRFVCRECPEEQYFATKAKYMYHVGSRHPGNIQFVCDVCTLVFRLKANYKAHMATHGNIAVKKGYTCEVCKGTFVNKAGFEAHQRRFPGPHMRQICTHCGFSFSREQHLKNHRCKILLIEEAKANSNNEKIVNVEHVERNETETIPEVIIKSPTTEISNVIPTAHIIPSGQMVHFEVNGTETVQQLYQIVPDWSVVSPYVIREK